MPDVVPDWAGETEAPEWAQPAVLKVGDPHIAAGVSTIEGGTRGKGIGPGGDIGAEMKNEPAPDWAGVIARALFPESETDDSLVGLPTAEGVPTGKTAVGKFARSVEKAGLGMGDWISSPRGIVQTVTAATPARLVVMAQWAYDMAKGGGQEAGDLSTLLTKPDKTADDYQQISDHTVNTLVSLLAAGKLKSDMASELTGVRAPLTRGMESKPTRLAKDLAVKLDESTPDWAAAALGAARPVQTPVVPTAVVAPLPDVLEKWRSKGVRLDVSENDNVINLDHIGIPEGDRGKGIGDQILGELKSISDKSGKPIELLPAVVTKVEGDKIVDDGSGLLRFYSRNGFEPVSRGLDQWGRPRAPLYRYTPTPAEGNEIAGFGGSPRRAPQKVTTPPQVAATPAPPAHPIAQYVTSQTTGIKSVMAPHALSSAAGDVGNALRHFMGENATAMARAEEALHSFRSEFDQTPVPADWVHDPAQPLPHNYAVIDALERDRSALPPRYQQLADTFDKEFKWRIDEIQKYAAHALQHLVENYFPHIWQDPVRASDAMAQVSSRLFSGRKEFLKQRSLPFFREGLERGLKPISDNPVDLLMAKMHSMDKFLLALKAQSEFKASGAMKFKYLFEKLPDGWQTVEDPAFVVQRPPTVEITEAFDSFQRAKLGEALQLLGVNYKRVASLGGSRWAEADRGMKEIRAKVGSHEPTLWHELGHQADWKFPELRQSLETKGNSPIAQQLRALADLRAEGKTVSKSHQKYLRKTEEKMAELFRAYVHAPELFQSTAPDVWKAFNGFLDTQPQFRDVLNEMRRGRLAMGDETTTLNLGGMQVLGHWIMPDGGAAVLKNYLSPGLSRFAPYRSFRAASNILNGAQLGLSAFHLGFTSLDAATSRLAIGLEDLSRGHVVKAAKTFASVPASPLTNILQGRRIMKEALRPGSTDAATAEIVKALEHGGGRIGQDRFWQTDFMRRLKRAFHEARNNDAFMEPADLKVLWNAPFTAIEQAMRPIMEYVVPRQKLGVFADMARRELDRLGPGATKEQTREAMRKAWDSVDNRMGQVVYDNLFYNRAVKDLSLLTFRAYGWQLGKYREGFGALADTAKAAGGVVKGRRPEVSHRMAYAMALPMMVGLIGGTLNYLMTGQRPQDWRDWFMPRTGEKDLNGNDARVHLPSYMKDVLAYAKHPITSVGHSLNPMFSVMFDLLGNKDFYNVQIRNPDDPLYRQGSDVAAFAAKQFIPFSVSGTIKLHEQGTPIQKEILPYFGITPVPMRMTMTPAQELAAEITGANMPAAPRTKEQYDRTQLAREIVQDFRNGQNTSGRSALAQGFQTGQLNANTVMTIVDKLQYTPLQFQVHHMDVPAAMRVWRVASPSERDQASKSGQSLRSMIETKIANSKTLPPDEARQYIEELKRN